MGTRSRAGDVTTVDARRRPWALWALALVLGCTDSGLQPTEPEEKETFDNLLTIRGEHCVQPDARVEFPVKVLLIVDQSASLQCTDPQNRRFNALNDLVDTILRNRATRIGVIGFSSWTRQTDFTNDKGIIWSEVGPDARSGGTATDYQGALATAVRVIEQDIVETRKEDPGAPARTRYVVTYISDGVPEPRCNAGCEDDEINCSDGEDNDGDGSVDGSDGDCANVGDNLEHPDNLYGICNTTEDITEIREAADYPEYVEFETICPAYNQPDQIMQRVSDLIALRDIYSVGDVTLHTVFLFSAQSEPGSLCEPFFADFAYDAERARVLLRAMADAGDGAFRDVNLTTAPDDTFLQFDFHSLEAPQWSSSFMALDRHARVSRYGFEPDTDIDGLADDVEQEAGTDPRTRDTDEDLYSDLFETLFQDSGFDPLDPESPAVPCEEESDLDGDGLLDCEESFAATDLRHPDTDGDGIHDWLEMVAGTDPLDDDSAEDLDFDGIVNADEIRGGTDPLRPDEDRYRDSRVRYQRTDLGMQEVERWGSSTVEQRRCSEFEVSDIQLTVTPVVPDRGLNRIMLYAQEQPAQLAGARSETFVACFEVFYRGPASKDPESGIIDVSSGAWTETLLGIQDEIDELESCDWFGASFDRARIRQVIEQCLPSGIRLGRFEYTQEEALNLLRDYVAENNAVNLPRSPSELFVHIERFNPRQHCYRPWEIDYLFDLLGHVTGACDSCTGRERGAPPATETDGGEPDAGGPNRCCWTM
jgi:hypothetical protein